MSKHEIPEMLCFWLLQSYHIASFYAQYIKNQGSIIDQLKSSVDRFFAGIQGSRERLLKIAWSFHNSITYTHSRQ